MTNLNELSVYRDTYDLVGILLDFVNTMSKTYKYSLGQRIIDTSLDLFESLQIAYNYKDKHKEYIFIYLNKLELLKILVRICSEKHIFTIKQLTRVNMLLFTITKQIKK